MTARPRSRNGSRQGRRDFLRAIGASAALLPFLPRLESEAAAAGLPSKRLVVFQTPNGTILRNWRIEGATHGSALPAELSQILQPLAPYRDRMIVVDGVDNIPGAMALEGDIFQGGKGHTSAGALWTQWAPVHLGDATCDGPSSCTFPQGPSFEQYVANEIGGGTPYSSVTLGVSARGEPNGLQNRSFYDMSGHPVSPENDPVETFNLLFADLSLDPVEMQRVARERRSVIDYVKGDLSRVSSKLSGTDQQRIEAHLDGMRSLEKSLQDATTCTVPDAVDAVNIFDDSNIPIVTQLQLGMAAQALACDLTNVIGFQWGREGSWGRASWLGQTEGSHTLSHWEGAASQEAAIQAMTDLSRWHAEQLASFVDRLKELGALDDTLIVWSSSLSEGHDHGSRNVPIVLVQGEAGSLETGRYLKYGSCPSIVPSKSEDMGGQSMTRLIVSLCRAMGLDSVDSFGDATYGTGPLPGL